MQVRLNVEVVRRPAYTAYVRQKFAWETDDAKRRVGHHGHAAYTEGHEGRDLVGRHEWVVSELANFGRIVIKTLPVLGQEDTNDSLLHV